MLPLTHFISHPPGSSANTCFHSAFNYKAILFAMLHRALVREDLPSLPPQGNMMGGELPNLHQACSLVQKDSCRRQLLSAEGGCIPLPERVFKDILFPPTHGLTDPNLQVPALICLVPNREHPTAPFRGLHQWLP